MRKAASVRMGLGFNCVASRVASSVNEALDSWKATKFRLSSHSTCRSFGLAFVAFSNSPFIAPSWGDPWVLIGPCYFSSGHYSAPVGVMKLCNSLLEKGNWVAHPQDLLFSPETKETPSLPKIQNCQKTCYVLFLTPNLDHPEKNFFGWMQLLLSVPPHNPKGCWEEKPKMCWGGGGSFMCSQRNRVGELTMLHQHGVWISTPIPLGCFCWLHNTKCHIWLKTEIIHL